MQKVSTILILFIFGATVLFSCKPADPFLTAVSELESTEQAERDSALQRLNRMELIAEQKRSLVKEAARIKIVGGDLLKQLLTKQDEELVAALRREYINFQKEEKTAILSYLSNFASVAAIQAWTSLVLSDAANINRLDAGILYADHRFKNILFPDLYKLLDDRRHDASVALILLNHMMTDAITPSEVADYDLKLANTSSTYRKQISSYDAAKDKWSDPLYRESERRASILADLLGYLDGPASLEELNNYTANGSNRLEVFAMISRLRRGETINEEDLNRIAADMVNRNLLFDQLEKLGAGGLYPFAWKGQVSFAECNLVQWLIHPNEMGRPPDAIALSRREEFYTNIEEVGMAEFYLFKFKSEHPDWSEKGWMAGLAGYYPSNKIPTTKDVNFTFSAFEPWDDKSPKEHIRHLVALVKAAQ